MIALNYILEEHGWAVLDAELGSTRIRFKVSYMSHALNDMVTATIAVLAEPVVARFALIDEPGSFCWVLAREGELLQITVAHIDSMYAVERYNDSEAASGLSPPEEGGQFVASAECSVFEFGTAVARMLKEIRTLYAEDDFTRTHNKASSPDLSTQLSRLLELRI